MSALEPLGLQKETLKEKIQVKDNFDDKITFHKSTLVVSTLYLKRIEVFLLNYVRPIRLLVNLSMSSP